MAFINEKKVNWDLTTPNSGLLLKEEYEQLYVNDNYLKAEVERVDTDLINHEKDYFTYGIVQGFEVTLSAATGSVDVSEGIARDQAGRRMQRSAETGYGITDGETVKVICRFTDTEIIIDDIPADQAPADNELVLAQVTRSVDAVTIVDERVFAGLVVNNIDHPQGVLIEGERVAQYNAVLSELAILNIEEITATAAYWSSVCYGYDLFVAVNKDGEIYTSSDGITWTKRTVDNYSGFLYCVYYGNGLFVAGGTKGEIPTSEDGITWTARTAAGGYTGTFSSICYGNGLFVAVGSYGEIQTSEDGITWTARTAAGGFSDNISSICYGNGLFVAGGSYGEIQTSEDGITWTARTAAGGYTGTFSSICYGNGLFVAGGSYGEIQTSEDGMTWTARTAAGGYTGTFSSICYGNGLFVAGGSKGEILTSKDGATWVARTAAGGSNYNIPGICYGNGQFVAVVNGGEIQCTPKLSLP